MGKSSTPTYNPPAPVQRVSGQQLFSDAGTWAQNTMPGAYGARESALKDVNDPNYYSRFQPTSFEQALGNQYFQNVWPDQQKAIMNQLSRSGMADSPVAADVLGRTLGRTQFDIGSYLSNLGQQRAQESLNYRNIDPMGILQPYVSTSADQSNLSAEDQNQYNQAIAQQQYQDALNKYNQKNAMQKMFGQISPIGGAIYGGVTGGGSGLMNSLGGTMDTLKMFAPAIAGDVGMPGIGSYLTSGASSMFGGGPSNGGALPQGWSMPQSTATPVNPWGANYGASSYSMPRIGGGN